MQNEKEKGNMELGRVGCDSTSEESIKEMRKQVMENSGLG